MLTKIIFLQIFAFLIFNSLFVSGNAAVSDTANYVKLEARGTLFKQDATYYIQTVDSNFSSVNLRVKLERSEDKNRGLDNYLEKLNGKSVIVHGFLDCRRVGQEEGTVYIYLNNESQVTTAEDK